MCPQPYSRYTVCVLWKKMGSILLVPQTKRWKKKSNQKTDVEPLATSVAHVDEWDMFRAGFHSVQPWKHKCVETNRAANTWGTYARNARAAGSALLTIRPKRPSNRVGVLVHSPLQAALRTAIASRSMFTNTNLTSAIDKGCAHVRTL